MGLSRRSVAGAAGVLAVAVVAFGLVSGHARSTTRTVVLRPAPTRGGPRSLTVPLEVTWFGPGILFSAHVMVDVRVGNGPKVPVLLDTGSEGLHIYGLGVNTRPGGGVSITGRPDMAHYADGTIESGVVADARLTIGSVRTRRAVPFGLIQSVGCDAQHPTCPATTGMAHDAAHGMYGIMGIELWREPDGLSNPLLALPAPYSQAWSLALSQHSGKLVLAAPMPQHPAAVFQLKRDGRDPSGARAWSDRWIKVCWAYSGMQGAACQPTLFDSGNTVGTDWAGGALSHAPTESGTDLVAPGTFIAAWQPGAAQPFWGFTAGEDLSTQMVAVNRGSRFAWTSNRPFFVLRFTYDAAHGRMLISQR